MPEQDAHHAAHHAQKETTLRFAVLGFIGRAWGRVEAAWTRFRRRAHRQRAQIEAEARLLGAEVRQLGAQLWKRVDELPLPERFKFAPIKTQFYGHGAFMGAAPAMLADPKWRRILAFLMPDVFEQVLAAFDAGKAAPHVIPMMENNPVMAAYGIWRGAQSTGADDASNANHLTGLEWDVFVDGALVGEWAAVRGNPAQEAAVMLKLLDTTLIAHASGADTVQEQMGLDQYMDVRKTPKTQFGGVELDSWLDIFGRALWLSHAADLNAAVASMTGEPRVDGDDDDECMRHTFIAPWPVRKAVDVYKEVTGRANISVVLEIKSIRSTPEFLVALVRALNERGVHVAGVASFLREEVEGVAAVAQQIDGVAHPGPRELQFFHYAGDVQHACEQGEIDAGQNVLFNGASLLDVFHPEGGAAPVYSTKLGVVRELEDYRARYGMRLGLYVQEGDCDHAAASLLSDLVTARHDTFELGFAWGGLRDEAGVARSHEPRVGYGSQRVLEKLGKAKQWRERVATDTSGTPKRPA